MKGFFRDTKQVDLNSFVPRTLRDFIRSGARDQKRVPSLAKDPELVKVIEQAVREVPTHHVLFLRDRRYPERTLTIDIDKRIKEVKYTSIDLKRRTDPQVTKEWAEFITETPPAFFSAWPPATASSTSSRS